MEMVYKLTMHIVVLLIVQLDNMCHKDKLFQLLEVQEIQQGHMYILK